MPRVFRLLFAVLLLLPALLPLVLSAQAWTPVPPCSFSSLSLSQFADHELEVPYFLNHFAQVANAVVESGTDRGFLNIKVNRDPVDNQTYNARIMENQLALAYFYTANRPWNPYYGQAVVRVRLEAMLDRWTRIQAPDTSASAGLFAEYSATNWSLAPTGFGVLHAAQALDLVAASGLTFDAVVLENSRLALRKALLALFTRADMRSAARQYSNQFNGSYHAALLYLARWPDSALDAAFVQAVNASSAQDQSLAGFFYEQGGPDFGYSSVHENNLRIALPRLRQRTDLFPIVQADDLRWNQWLAANYVPQPGSATPTYLVNAGINTRTSHGFLTPATRPLSEFSAPSRVFSYTDTEYASLLVNRRAQVQTQFGKWGALSVPNAYSYIPSFVFDAVQPLNVWQPTAAQRDAALAALPCRASGSVNRQFHDAWPVTVTTVRRPAYYAALTTGNIRITRQVYGLGLLWHEKFGVALQSVAATLSGNTWVWGTRRSGVTSGTYETANLAATLTAGGATVTPATGVRDLASGDVVATYPLAASGTTYGQKTVTFGTGRVDVAITHSGAFTELLPLAHASDAVLSSTATRLTFQRPNGASLVIETTSPGATFTVGGTSALTTGIVRRAVSIAASGSLSYRLTLSDQPPLVLPALTVSDATVNQPASGTANLVFTLTLTPASASAVTVNYATANGTALAGTHFTATSGTLAFAVGQTSQTVTVPVSAGTLLQGTSLALSLRLITPSGASVANDTATGTINGITPPPPPPPGSALVEYVPGNSWGSGYQGTFKITNSSTATITGYELLFDFSGTTFTFFNGTLTRAGTACTFTPLSWQATIPAGTFFDNLGFQASPGDALPLSPRLRITSATGVSTLQITTAATLPGTSAGTAFSQTLAVGGGIGPYTWSLAPGSTLPGGLTLSSAGALTGTPVTGSFSFSLRVTDLRSVSVDRAFSLAVAAPPSAYATWLANTPWAAADSAPTADPDVDGLPNLLEYAFGSNPLDPRDTDIPVCGLNPSASSLTLTFLRARSDLTYEIQASSDLAAWQTIATNPGTVSASTPLTFTDSISLATAPRRFLRLRVTPP